MNIRHVGPEDRDEWLRAQEGADPNTPPRFELHGGPGWEGLGPVIPHDDFPDDERVRFRAAWYVGERRSR